MWAYLLALALIAVTGRLWCYALLWVGGKTRPHLARWIWRRLGGEGDPPDRHES